LCSCVIGWSGISQNVYAELFVCYVLQVQPNNYASFYDDTRQSWSLMFESESNLIQFVKQVIEVASTVSVVT